MYPIGKVWLNVCSQADDGKSNAGDMQGRSQCREEKYIYILIMKKTCIYIYGTPPPPKKSTFFMGKGGNVLEI